MLFCSIQAEQDDDFSFLPGLEIYKIADKELDIYNYESAQYQYETILNDLEPADSLERIYGLAKLAKVFWRVHKYEEAWNYITEAEEIAQQYFKEDHTIMAFLYYEKGELASLRLRYVDAEEYLTASIEMRTRLHGEDHCMTAYSIKELGEFYFYCLADYHQAEPLLRKSFEILDDCVNGNTYQKALAYYDLAAVYWSKTEITKARELLDGAMEILFNCSAINWDFIPNCYNFMAINARLDQDRSSAIEYSIKAVEIRERYSPQNVKRLIHESQYLAECYIADDQNTKALKYLDKANSYYHQNDMENPAVLADLLFMYGYLYSITDSPQKFYDRFTDGLTELGKIHGECHINIVKRYRQLGWLAGNNLEEYDSAHHYFDRAINCMEANSTIEPYQLYELADLYNYKAELALKLYAKTSQVDHLGDAFTNYLGLDSVLRVMKAKSDWQSSKLYYSKYYKSGSDDAIECASQLIAADPEQKDQIVEEVFGLMETNRSYLLYESINQNLELKRDDLPDSLKDEIIRMDSEIKMLELDTTGKNRVSRLARLEVLQSSKQAINGVVEGIRYEDNLTMFTRKISNLKECREQMNDKECILQYYRSADQYYLLGIKKESTLFQALGDLDSIQALLNLLHYPTDQTSNYASHVKRYQLLANRVYEQIIPGDFISGMDVIVIPDGQLFYLPFEALVSNVTNKRTYSGLQYMLKDNSVRYAYSSTQFVRLNDLVNDRTKGVYAVFPHTDLSAIHAEQSSLAKIFKKIEFAADEMDKNDLIDRLKNREIIHFATHGYADTTSLNSTYLELSGGQKLFEYEISTTFLNSRLIYLNACETNLGKEYKGEGVFSLSKSFMQAGCPTVISSIWKIPDNAASNLAQRFYSSLSNDVTALESFRQAKLQYLSTENELTCHPYYWSGLIFMGNNPILLVNDNTNKIGYTILGILLVLVVSVLYIIRQKRYRQPI